MLHCWKDFLLFQHLLPLPGFLILYDNIYSHLISFAQSTPVTIPVMGMGVGIPKLYLYLAGNVLTQYPFIKLWTISLCVYYIIFQLNLCLWDNWVGCVIVCNILFDTFFLIRGEAEVRQHYLAGSFSYTFTQIHHIYPNIMLTFVLPHTKTWACVTT